MPRKKSGQKRGPSINVNVLQHGPVMMIFFCHWLAETEEDIHNALRDNQLYYFVFTACYEALNYIDTACLSDERAFPKRATLEA